MSLDELVAASSVVARVRCVSVESRWDTGRIWTFTAVETLESLKGAAPASFTIRLPGGKAGSLAAKVEGAPRFRRGEDVVLFLQPTGAGDWTVVSWVQGTFRVRETRPHGEERVTQDTGGVALFNPATRAFEPGGVKDLPLGELRDRVHAAVRRAGGTRGAMR